MSKKVLPIRSSTPNYDDEEIPDKWKSRAELVAQGITDLDTPWLWVGSRGQSYHDKLEELIAAHKRDEWNPKVHRAMWKIIHHNNELRDKRKLQQAAPSEPPALTVVEPPAPAAVGEAPIVCDPPLAARYIGMGWGLADGNVVTRMQERFPELWPAPIDLPGHKTKLYRRSDIDVFTAQPLVQKALRAALAGQRSLQADRLKEENAALRAEVAALRAKA